MPSWEEDFNFDPTGNWHGTTTGYKTLASGTTTLDQNRSHSKANEVTGITTNSGTAWVVPTQDLIGNLTKVPQPGALGSSYDCKYDAWNRLVEVKLTGGAVVGTYKYDGFKRRIQSITASTRDFYYSRDWQILEERVGGTLERQHVWGLRYVDDYVLRDRDTNGDGTLDERRYVLHDYFNVTAITDAAAAVQERYGYDAFGTGRVMTSAFGSSSAGAQTTDFGFAAYRWDKESGLFQVRNRYLHPKLGRWLSRDPRRYRDGLNLYWYVRNRTSNYIDPTGTQSAVLPVLGFACVCLLVYGVLQCFRKPVKVAPIWPAPDPDQPKVPVPPIPDPDPRDETEICPKEVDKFDEKTGDRYCEYWCRKSGTILKRNGTECDKGSITRIIVE